MKVWAAVQSELLQIWKPASIHACWLNPICGSGICGGGPDGELGVLVPSICPPEMVDAALALP